MWMLTWRLGEGKVGIKSPLNIECTKTILFSTLIEESEISNSLVLKTQLFLTGPPKTQASLINISNKSTSNKSTTNKNTLTIITPKQALNLLNDLNYIIKLC